MYDADVPSILAVLLPRLWAFALRLSRNQLDAEHLVRRACLRALERKHQMKPDISPLNWMFSIVHSVWLDKLRTRNVRRGVDMERNDGFLETLVAPAAPGPETDMINRQVVSAVDQLLHAQRTRYASNRRRRTQLSGSSRSSRRADRDDHEPSVLRAPSHRC